MSIVQKERERGVEGWYINPADVEHGSLIDINGTLFRRGNSPGFSHRPRGTIAKALGARFVREELSEKKMGFDGAWRKAGN